MNALRVGSKRTLKLVRSGCLFITHQRPDFRRVRTFDFSKHSFNLLDRMSYEKSCAIVEDFDALFPRGDGTIMKDTGLDAIGAALLVARGTLETLIPEPNKQSSTGEIWAYGKVRRLMRSPVLRKVLCGESNFSFKNPRSVIVLYVDPALVTLDARALVLFMMSQFKGQIVVDDYGRYAHEGHLQLLQEERLMVRVNTLSELPPLVRDRLLLSDDRLARGALYQDAVVLAQQAGLRPDLTRERNPYNEFIDAAMG